MRITGASIAFALAALPLLAAAPALAQTAPPAPAASETVPTAGALPFPDYPPAEGAMAVPPGMRVDPLLGPVPDDGKLHGVAEVGVGTGGYREGMAAVTGSLPHGGSLSIAVQDTQFQYGGRRRSYGAPWQALNPNALNPNAPNPNLQSPGAP